ncbi:unnamed protein product [Vitrella brassicaformis CCMP3155]|uniref:Uncharacterized protein n=1 Tax=Vitrella brassicaformis (strain CCMP3155) TaxID=1169540 RepID=A0A0G4EI06_VITBC|nr:unnamed protein product [Vitrella brassicaformis CCMP3155]|eukprot:CEL95595.1 unnamed protein product [Vitrella brassicaformis CCMP3155]
MGRVEGVSKDWRAASMMGDRHVWRERIEPHKEKLCAARVTFGFDPGLFDQGDAKHQYARAGCIECDALADYNMGNGIQLCEECADVDPYDEDTFPKCRCNSDLFKKLRVSRTHTTRR